MSENNAQARNLGKSHLTAFSYGIRVFGSGIAELTERPSPHKALPPASGANPAPQRVGALAAFAYRESPRLPPCSEFPSGRGRGHPLLGWPVPEGRGAFRISLCCAAFKMRRTFPDHARNHNNRRGRRRIGIADHVILVTIDSRPIHQSSP